MYLRTRFRTLICVRLFSFLEREIVSEMLDLFEQVALLTEAAAVLVHHLHVFMSHEYWYKHILVCTHIMSLMYMRVYNVCACT